ncbi:MAG: hypothetical protein FWG88_04415 [Oscillospiraceae bacterium]|nr:hypothetical protein [Oscillospiraceae bacterium]
MKTKTTSTIAIILILSILITLTTSCTISAQTATYNDSEDSNQYVYRSKYVALPEEVDDVSSLSVIGDRVYFSTQALNYLPNHTTITTIPRTTRLYSFFLDGTDLRELENYVHDAKFENAPSNTQGTTSIIGMQGDSEGNIWILEKCHLFYYDVPEGFYEQSDYWKSLNDYWRLIFSGYLLRKLDSTGAELQRINLSDIMNEIEIELKNNYETFIIDNDGNLYIGSSNVLFILNPEGEFLFLLDAIGIYNNLFMLSDGSIAQLNRSLEHNDSSTFIIKKIDLETRNWGEEIILFYTLNNAKQGIGTYDLVYYQKSCFYGVDTISGESAALLDKSNCDINLDLVTVDLMIMLPEESFLFVAFAPSYRNQIATLLHEIIILSKVPADRAVPRITLTLACNGFIWPEELAWYLIVYDFNKNNNKYLLEIKNYASYDIDKDGITGLEQLIADILYGDAPDLIITTNIPYRKFAATGMLSNLYTFIDFDKQLKRDALVRGVFNAAEENGKLFQVFPTFFVDTIWGNQSILGENNGWNLDEFTQFMQANPQSSFLRNNYDKSDLFSKLVMLNLDNYINWSSDLISFNTDEFVSFLEQVKAIPLNESYRHDYSFELITDNKRIMETGVVESFLNTMLFLHPYGEAVFKGYPCENRRGNIITFEYGVAMTSTSKNKLGAWQFIYEILAEDRAIYTLLRYKSDYLPEAGFSTNYADLQKHLDEITTQRYHSDEQGNDVPIPKIWFHENSFQFIDDEYFIKYSHWFNEGTYLYAMSQNEANKILDLFDTASCVIGEYDNELISIISQAARYYFDGRITAKEAAATIQNKVETYVVSIIVE